MTNSYIEGASQAINKTVTMVGDALGIDIPRSSVPSISRETMVEMLKEGFRSPSSADCWCNQLFVGWGSQVRLKREKTLVWVDDPDPTTNPVGFLEAIDKVVWHLRKGHLVDWGGEGDPDDVTRLLILRLDKWYRRQNPAYKKIRWDAQPPSYWGVFYVDGMDDIDDDHNMKRVARALKAGKRIIDISGKYPDDLTAAYRRALKSGGGRRR